MVGIIRIQLHVEEDKYILLVWEKLIDLGFKDQEGLATVHDVLSTTGYSQKQWPPTRLNFDYKGVDLDSVCYPICDNDIENEEHLYVYSDTSINTWARVLQWWGSQILEFQASSRESTFEDDLTYLLIISATLILCLLLGFGEFALSDLIMEKGFLDSGGRGRNQRKKDTTLRSSNDPAATNAADKKHDSKDDEVNTSVTEPFSSVSDTYGSPNSLAQKLHDIPNPGQDTSGPSVVQTYGLSVMATNLGNPSMLDSYTSSMCLESWGRMDYSFALIDIGVDRELKDEMVIAISNVEYDGEVMHVNSKVPRKGTSSANPFDALNPSSSCGTNVGSKVQFNHKKPIWQAVSKKNSASSSGTKKNFEVPRKVTIYTNPFDELNTIEEGDELRSNRGSSNSSKKVVQDVAVSASGSPSNTPLVTRINELESQMIDEKLVLLGDDGKPLKPYKPMVPSSYYVVFKKVDC
ncbi:hypothetical protein Tco_0156773 [Tanacetum coccineum]